LLLYGFLVELFIIFYWAFKPRYMLMFHQNRVNAIWYPSRLFLFSLFSIILTTPQISLGPLAFITSFYKGQLVWLLTFLVSLTMLRSIYLLLGEGKSLARALVSLLSKFYVWWQWKLSMHFYPPPLSMLGDNHHVLNALNKWHISMSSLLQLIVVTILIAWVYALYCLRYWSRYVLVSIQ